MVFPCQCRGLQRGGVLQHQKNNDGTGPASKAACSIQGPHQASERMRPCQHVSKCCCCPWPQVVVLQGQAVQTAPLELAC